MTDYIEYRKQMIYDYATKLLTHCEKMVHKHNYYKMTQVNENIVTGKKLKAQRINGNIAYIYP